MQNSKKNNVIVRQSYMHRSRAKNNDVPSLFEAKIKKEYSSMLPINYERAL